MLIILLFLLKLEYVVDAQSLAAKEWTLKKVFAELVNAYGQAKQKPDLEFLRSRPSQGHPASYLATPSPIITMEEKVFDLCMQMGPDSLNALAVVLSHELAHYYQDHTWCTDYAWAIRNTPLGQLMSTQAKGDKIQYETQADHHGLYYSCIAGYSPFGVYDKLIDKIYQAYQLPAVMTGYPSKGERKMIARNALEQIKRLYPIYDAGLLLLYLNHLEEAASCFDYLAKFFPSREIYNNLGVTKFLTGSALQPYNPVNLIYPIDIDPESRIFQNDLRSEHQLDGSVQYLQEAKKNFEKAVSLDPDYGKSYKNLACVHDALGNNHLALGYLQYAEQLIPEDSISIKHIKAIISYHAGQRDHAELLMQTISDRDKLAAYNYRLMALARSTNGDIIKLEKYKMDYQESLINKDTISLGVQEPFPDEIKGKKETVQINAKMTITSELRNDFSNLQIELRHKNINSRITVQPNTDQKKNVDHFKYRNQDSGYLILYGQMNKIMKYRIIQGE